MHRLTADLFDGQGDRDAVARPLIARVLIPDCAISDDRPASPPTRIRVNRRRWRSPGQRWAAALGQRRPDALLHATRHDQQHDTKPNECSNPA